jgi:hypothetical protein
MPLLGLNNQPTVAGSYPIYLRSDYLGFDDPPDWGDWEQTTPKVYTVVNYLELYVLGAYGAGRKQVQIINKYDPCCFAGVKWQTYGNVVSSRVHQLGDGNFDVFLDDTHKDHSFSKSAVQRIINELRNG